MMDQPTMEHWIGGIVTAAIALVGTMWSGWIGYKNRKLAKDHSKRLAAQGQKITTLELELKHCNDNHTSVTEQLKGCEQRHEDNDRKNEQFERQISTLQQVVTSLLPRKDDTATKATADTVTNTPIH